MSHSMGRAAFAQFIESGFEPSCELFSRPSAPVVKEDDDRTVSRHVVMNRDDIKTVLSNSPI